MDHDTKDEKLSFWHSLRIFNKDLDILEKEVTGEIPATERHIDIHIEEAQEKSNFLREQFSRLFKKGE